MPPEPTDQPRPRNQRPTLLLTGATGVLGQALVEEFCGDYDVLCLRHRTPLDDPRVREVTADLQAPGLGLSAAQQLELAAEADVVVHSAAATNWRAAPADIWRTNLDGTLSMLDLAARADAPFFYMSTAFVANPLAAEEQGRFPGAAAYLASKTAAEDAVRSAPAPGVVLRPSVVMGDSTTGRIARVQGLTRALGGIVKGHVPVLPGSAGTRIDMVPQDVVARAVGDLVRAGVAEGVYWLTAGSAAILQREVVDVCLEFAERHGERPHPPRLIPLEAVHRLLLPLLEGPSFPESVRRRLQDYAELLLVFQRELPFESHLGTPHCGTAPTRAAIRSALERNVECWAAGRGGLRQLRRLQTASAPAELAS
ncbi:SDR family oxidoreductase [Streptomyces sp. FXJ1.172]|uniref:SDR family oxidoreductase n=1 Tax=Streptomyces sp. FXJ1.172 TaxID=710705 RepID=UPI0007D02824|nr:SDR family oxidoreductase [Streptomyces sp. FXJ1.172]WEO99871.1 SDR family oxidoreductase [Streptomyces sp. FXJ1.172]